MPRKSVSVTSIAKEAGVSHATVSMVLNSGQRKYPISESCSQRIRDIAKRLGYVPNYHARAMKNGCAGVVAVVMDVEADDPKLIGDPGATQLGLPYFGTIIGAIELFTRAHGYFTTIVGPDKNSHALERGVLGLRQRRFDGLIVPGSSTRPESVSFMIESPQEPIVAIEYSGQTQLPVVEWDEPAGVALMVKHLAGLGHQELLWLGPAVSAGREIPTAREQLFMTAVWDAGLRGSSCRFDSAHAGFFGPTVEAAAEALRKHIAEKSATFTAVAAYNDVVAIGACAALQEAGLRMPADVSVIGFDNVVAPLASPPLTTVSHKLYELGQRATELLFEMISDEAAIAKFRGKREVIPPELVVRKSTGPVRRE
jgi:LacI family transcriptional regulator